MTFKSGAVAIGSFVVMMGVTGFLFAQTSGDGAMKNHDTMATPGDSVKKDAPLANTKTVAPHAKKSKAASSKSVSNQPVSGKLVPQKTCPVQGDPIDKNIYVDYKGKRVYFCCAGCPEIFKKDPEKYLAILAGRGEAPIDVPKK